MYAYVIVSSAVAIALVQIIFGDGIDWVSIVVMTAVVTFGLWIGRFIRARQSTQ